MILGDIIKILGFDLNFKMLVILLVVIIIFLVIISMVTSSGHDVTVNGVSFHLPAGFDDVEKVDSDNSLQGEDYIYKNPENHQYIEIGVYDLENDNLDMNIFSKKGYKQTTIDGKEGYGKLSTGLRYGYTYVDNGKYIIMDVPVVLAEEGMQYEELLSEIIK